MGERDDTGWWPRLPFAELSGVASSARTEVSLAAARDVRPVVERVYLGAVGPGSHAALRAIGSRVAESEKARSRLAGYLFEHLDSQRYNLGQMTQPAAVRRFMQLCEGPTFPGYDAFRYAGGELSDGIQHKLCVSDIRPAATRLELRWPGSARETTFRVPSDVADQARLLAGERCRIEASEFSKAEVYKRLDRGADQLARRGSGATSRVSQTARAGAKSGAVAAVVGGVLDAPKVWRREMRGKHFLARRGMDAAEGAATTVATSGVVAATMSVAATVAAAGGTGAVTATAVLTAPAWVPTVVVGLLLGTGVRHLTKGPRQRVDDHFASETAVDSEPIAESSLVEDLDACRPRPWIPAAAAAMLVVPTLSLWTPNPFALWWPGSGRGR